MECAILWCNLGTPDEPTPAAVRRYLAEFLSDPRVVEIPRAVWQPLLRGVILPLRAPKSAAKYAKIWGPDGSPLKTWTEKQSKLLQGWLGERGHRVKVRYAMRYGSPSIASQLDALKSEGVKRVLVMQAYPQYSCSTTASVIDEVGRWARLQRAVPELRFVNDFHDDTGYVEALVKRVERSWREGRPDHLVMSFHGVPERTVRLGDPYQAHCLETARRLAGRLGLEARDFTVSFQSRFGRAKWLQPATDAVLAHYPREGVKRVAIATPGFSADCIETLEELGIRGRETFRHAGGEQFALLECLNDSPEGMDMLTRLVARELAGWREQS